MRARLWPCFLVQRDFAPCASATSAAVAFADGGKRTYYHVATSIVLINMIRWEAILETIGVVFERNSDAEPINYELPATHGPDIE